MAKKKLELVQPKDVKKQIAQIEKLSNDHKIDLSIVLHLLTVMGDPDKKRVIEDFIRRL